MWIFESAAVMLLLTVGLAQGAAGPDCPVKPPVAAKAKASLTATNLGAPEAPWKVSFHDGSGNGLRIWKASKQARIRFQFTPVQPENSATKLYSGGKAARGRVDVRNTQELWRWVRKLEGDASLRAERREKGTGAFHVNDSSGREREFLIEAGPLLREFTEWLRTEVVGPENYNPTMRKPSQ